jgi:hypothetical protein
MLSTPPMAGFTFSSQQHNHRLKDLALVNVASARTTLLWGSYVPTGCAIQRLVGYVEPEIKQLISCCCVVQTKYKGIVSVNGVQADHWFLDANFTDYDNNYYSTTDSTARPVRFMEHVSDHGGRPKVSE